MKEKKFCMDCDIRLKAGSFLEALTGKVYGTEFKEGWRCIDCEAKMRRVNK